MKVNITLDMTPEEAKKMLNLPDMSSVVEKMITDNMSGYFKPLPTTEDAGKQHYPSIFFPWMKS